MSSLNGLNMANGLNSINASYPLSDNNSSVSFRADLTQQPDSFELSAEAQELQPPRIGMGRLMLGLLTDKQVAQINASKKLPSNAKFVMNGVGGYSISNNFFGMRVGTQTLPEGFEVKKNVLGFAVVLPKGSDGLMLK